MKKIKSVIVGSGVIGAYLAELLVKKRHEVIVTSRFKNKNYKNYKNLKLSKKIHFKKLNILNKKNIEKFILKENPNIIFYFAGQSSLPKSFVLPRETYESNFVGAKYFLEIINKNKFSTKFFKANSGYIFKPNKGIIDLNSKLVKPNNPYVKAQQKAYQLIKKFRNKGLNCYSLIFMQIESPLRNNNFFIKKVCNHAKSKKKVIVGNINTIRDYSWIGDTVKAIYYSIFIKPCDLILSTGKKLSGKEILKFAYSINNLDYKNYYKINKKFIRKNELQTIIGSNEYTKKKLKKFRWKPKIYGIKLVRKIYNLI